MLIVDDHPGFRSFVSELLDGPLLSVVATAADGESAIAAVTEHRPDVVLLDVQLPGVGGFEVASRIADLSNPPPVILTSTRDADDFGSRLESARVIGFLPKQDLSAAAVAELLKGYRDGRVR